MRLILFVLLIGLPIHSKADESCQHTATRFNCVKYLKNYDGDTITFEIPHVHPLFGHNISVRVQGVDTAEIKTKDQCEKAAGRTAQKLVESLLKKSKRIDLTQIARDKYFRILADVEVDGKNLREILMRNRLAYAYEGGTKEKINWCERLPAASK